MSRLNRIFALALIALLGQDVALHAQPESIGLAEVPRPLTPEGQRFVASHWLPGSGKLVLVGENFSSVWLVNRDGSDLRKLAEGRGTGRTLGISDNALVAFRQISGSGPAKSFAIRLLDPESPDTPRLVIERGEWIGPPIWSGKRLSAEIDGEMKNLPVRGSSARTLIPRLRNIERQPRKYCYISSNRVIIREGDSESILLLPKLTVTAARPSPDFKQVLFELTDRHLYLVHKDGTHLQDLGVGAQGCWHPSGRYVVYVREVEAGLGEPLTELWVYDTQQSGARALTDSPEVLEHAPAVSRDGKWMSFADRMSGKIYTTTLASVRRDESVK